MSEPHKVSPAIWLDALVGKDGRWEHEWLSPRFLWFLASNGFMVHLTGRRTGGPLDKG
jgi:hypothetical protein